MSTSRGIRLLLAACAALAPAFGFGQSFNIDLDIGEGPPFIGNGVPSPTFGAAANQPGYWNRVYGTSANFPEALMDLAGAATSVTLTATGAAGTAIGYNNPENTGDYALLLNDTADITSQGHRIDYEFAGLANGRYLVVTYAASGYPRFNRTEVLVDGAVGTNPQVVTGPMPGNQFQLLVTHDLHDVAVADGTMRIHVSEIDPFGHVNGFQLVLVPEPSGFTCFLVFSACGAFLRRKKH